MIDAQRSNPREARAAARTNERQKAVAGPSKKRVTKTTRLNPEEKKAPRTKTRRTGEPVRAATPDGLPQRGCKVPEIPSPQGPPQKVGKGQGSRTSEGLPLRGGEASWGPTASLPHRGGAALGKTRPESPPQRGCKGPGGPRSADTHQRGGVDPVALRQESA
jgi:hypothetical protein